VDYTQANDAPLGQAPPVKIVSIGFGAHFANLINIIYAADRERTIREVVIVDPSEERLDLARALLDRLNAYAGRPLQVTCATAVDEGLFRGATHILFAAAVRYAALYGDDDELCRKYGVYQVEAETAGPGALLKTLRHLKLFEPVCELARRACPKAWMLVATNPIRHYAHYSAKHFGLKSLGLCHGSRAALRCLEWGYDLPEGTLSGELVGANHLFFFTKLTFTRTGEDAYPFVRELFREKGPNHWVQQYCHTMLDMYGLLPGNWSHVTDFFGTFPYDCWPEQGMDNHILATFAESLQRDEPHPVISRFRQAVAGELSLDEAFPMLKRDGGPTRDIIYEQLEALLLLDQPRFTPGVGAIRNGGASSDFDADAMLEMPAVLCRHYAQPVRVGPLPTACRAIVQLHVSLTDLIVDGFHQRSRGLIRQALALDPLFRDITKVDAFLDEAISRRPELYPELA